MAIQVVIDDVGWWCSEDGSARGEPFRTSCPRNHVPADYRAIIELGRRLNMHPQAAMVLCEWDRTNLLRKLPSSTWMGDAWDNARWQGPWRESPLVRSNAANALRRPRLTRTTSGAPMPSCSGRNDRSVRASRAAVRF
jgi:hypothetical protein